MDRVRRHPNRRKPFGNPSSPSPQSPSEPSVGRQSSSTSPVMSHAAGGSSPHARRASRPLQHAFTFSTPGSSRNSSLRKRSKTVDNYGVGDAEGDDDDDVDGDGPKKGGHTLRKRARVDYTFEHIEDEPVVPASSSAARNSRKRRSDGTDSEDFHVFGPRRRRTASPDTPSSRRRNPSRKSMEATAAYREEFGEDDPETKDTIEVGGSYSDVDESDPLQQAQSATSSPEQTLQSKERAINGIAEHDTQYEPFAGTLSRTVKRETPESVKAATEKHSKDITGHDDGPATQLQRESSMVQSKPESSAQTHASPIQLTEQPSEPSKALSPLHSKEQAAEGISVLETQVPTPGDAPASLRDESTVNDNDQVNQASTQLLQEAKPAEGTITEKPKSPQQPSEPKKTPEPEATLPVVDKPVVGESVTTESITTEPVAAEPVAAEPVASEPVAAEPVASEPVATEPVSAEPVAAEPVAAEPVAAEPVAAEPVVDEPVVDNTEEISQQLQPFGEAMDVDELPDASSSVAPASSTEDSQTSLADVNSTETGSTVVEEPARVDSVATVPSISVKPTPLAPSEKEKEVGRLPAVPKSTETESPTKTARFSRPQPTPAGRWSYLTPYVDGEYASYPEKKVRSEDGSPSEDQPSEEKDADKDTNDMEPMVEDNEDTPDAAMAEVATPALNTPTRGSPVPDAMEPTAFNSPAPAGEEPDEDVSESQEHPEARRYFKYRKLRDAEDYISAVENFEDMSTAELWEVLDACNVSLLQWQNEYAEQGRTVDDYENAQRRRLADTKYESRTRNLYQHGANYDEPDFATKGYKAKEKEVMSETRYLQSQDRIMAAAYGFEYDPHPSKIGRQNPETQQVGIMTRGRSLRNQPRQTAKATEADEVVGKRQRKPVQLFDPAAPQDISRSSTPVPTRGGRRRRTANVDMDDGQLNITSSFNEEIQSDAEITVPQRGRRRGRGGRPRAVVPTVEVLGPDTPRESPSRDEPVSRGRRGKGRAVDYDNYPFRFVDAGPDPSPRPSKRSHRTDATSEPKQKRMLTLKMPNPQSGAASVITDNGDSPRPSTASSDYSAHTAESSYSFRPKRQKRFRDNPDDDDMLGQGPPKKRGKRANTGDDFIMASEYGTPEAPSNQGERKVHKIKFVRPPIEQDERNGTPSSLQGTDDGDRKEYKTMTKSEKMSASMKSRWANGNMAGAVEKRKATLAAKKAAQAAAEQRVGLIAPKPNQPQNKPKPSKKEMPMQEGPPPEWAPGIPGMGYPFSTN